MIPQDSIKPALSRPPGLGMRHVVTLLGFWGFAMSYAMRVNLSIAIVAMVKRDNGSDPYIPPDTDALSQDELLKSEDNSTKDTSLGGTTCHANHNVSIPMYPDDDPGEFNWNEVEQGIILGSFFYGYMSTQLLGGILAQRYGGKWPLGFGLFVTAIFAILSPMAARTHFSLLIACRVIQGVAEGVTTPAMHCLLSKWAPPQERGALASITYSGTSFGTAATMIISGYLIQANVFGGWPSVFYVFGLLGLLWFVVWSFFIYEVPADHPRIKGDELYYIQRSIGDQLSKEKLPTPWRKMATSVPLWVIIIAHTGHTWGLYTLLTELPTYMKTVLKFDIKQNSWMSALPYGLMCVTGFVLPGVADTFIKRNWLSTLHVRKLCQIIAHLGAAAALIGASYSGCNATLTVALLTVAGGVNGAAFAGFGVNHIDIASNHAGMLMGVTNTVANISGFVAPYVAGLLINGNATLERWQIVFYIAAGVYAFDTLIFLIFASSDEQSWNRDGSVLPSINTSRTNLLDDNEANASESRNDIINRYEDFANSGSISCE